MSKASDARGGATPGGATGGGAAAPVIPAKSKDELVRELAAGEIGFHQLPRELPAAEAAEIRRLALEESTGVSLEHIARFSLDADRAAPIRFSQCRVAARSASSEKRAMCWSDTPVDSSSARRRISAASAAGISRGS